jgi:hypothetical protein
VPDHFSNELSVGHVPQPHDPIVSDRRQQRTVGADGDRSYPALMGIDNSERLRRVIGDRPPDEPTVVATSYERRTVLVESHPAHPGFGISQLSFCASLNVESPHAVILSSRKNKLTSWIKPAGNQRAGMSEVFLDVSLRDIHGRLPFYRTAGRNRRD